MAHQSTSPWPQRDDELRELWAHEPPLSTREIGRRMGLTKNSVVGRAHRLSLPARPSPIIRGRPTGPRKQQQAVRTAPVPLKQFVPRMKVYAPRPISHARECCWPIGEPGTAAFRFCEQPPVVGKPYCDLHCSAAYVPTRHPIEVPRAA